MDQRPRLTQGMDAQVFSGSYFGPSAQAVGPKHFETLQVVRSGPGSVRAELSPLGRAAQTETPGPSMIAFLPKDCR